MSKQCSGTTQAIVLDDDADTRFAVKRILEKCGCKVQEAESVEKTVALIETLNADVVFSDMRLPGAPGGEELLAAIHEQSLDVRLVLMSCEMNAAMRTDLLERGAAECVRKPFFKDTCEKLLGDIQVPMQKSA